MMSHFVSGRLLSLLPFSDACTELNYAAAAPDAQPGQAEATKDPMLRDKIHGKHLLEVRKQLAFQGYTFVSCNLIDHFDHFED